MDHIIQATSILFDKEFNRQGQVYFCENPMTNETDIYVYATNLTPGEHGFHIHQSGDLSQHCDSLCAHWNPFNKEHGGLDSPVRHLGDLGNVTANKQGVVNRQKISAKLPLRGRHSVIGRSVIIHQDKDDLGKGGNAESKKTGNAGKRVLCGVIGYSKHMC